MKPKIFISYRRGDSKDVAGRLYDNLVYRFGTTNVFRDRNTIAKGEHFVEAIKAAIDSCAVVLVVIGSRFLTIADERGNRRLFQPGDYTRFEIEYALVKNKTIIPVLVEQVAMPGPQELPASIKDLSFLQAERLTDEHWPEEIAGFCKLLKEKFGLQEITYGRLPKGPIPRILGTPPLRPNVFIGRDDELRRVHAKLFEENNLLLLVNGQGGIGKTTLAARYFHTYGDRYHHLAWVVAGTDLAESLLQLALPLRVPFPDTMPREERLVLLIQAMSNLPRPCLLVIDNANDQRELEKNYRVLQSSSNFHLLLTTRITEFEQAAFVRVQPLEKQKAFALFRQHYPGHRHEEDTLLENILVAVGYNTLVIELLAKNLRKFNEIETQYHLADLLRDLQERSLLTLSKSEAVNTPYHAHGAALRQEKPEDIIAAMYDLSPLMPPERKLLSVFAVLPAESIPYSVLKGLLPKEQELPRSLAKLSQNGWLEFNRATKSFKISPVVQEVTVRKEEALLGHCEELQNRLIFLLESEGYIGHYVNASYQEAALFARYAESVVDHFKGQLSFEFSILLERIGEYHRMAGNLQQALTFFEQRSQIGKELYEAFPDNVSFKNGLAISYSKLGETHSALGNLQQALTFFEQDADLSKELYEAFPDNVSFKNGLAISYWKLGDYYTKTKEVDRANAYFRQAEVLWMELKASFPEYAEFKRNLKIVRERLGGS